MQMLRAVRFAGVRLVFAAGALLAGCVGVAEGDAARPLRVAVYLDKGASGEGAFRHLQIATVARGVESFPVDAATIRAGALDKTDVLIMPGGYSVAEAGTLGEAGCERLREFIRGGGGYIGTCAGCYLLTQRTSTHKNMMGVVPFTSPVEFGTGHADLNVRFTGAAQELFGIRSNSIHRVSYASGPVLVPGEPVAGADFKILATYDSDYAEKKRGDMSGKAAMVAGTYGKGRVFLSTVHPEKDVDDHYVLKAAIRYVSGRKNIGWTLPHRRRGQLAVGVLCDASMGVAAAHVLQEIIRSEAFDLEPLSGDDVRGGEYDHCDVLLAVDSVEQKCKSPALGSNRRFTEAFLARGGRIVAWGAHGQEYAKLGAGVTVAKTADEAVAALKAMAAEPTPDVPEWALGKVEKPIRVAAYADRGGMTAPVVELLELSPEYEVKIVGGADIRRGVLKDADLLFMPGGTCQGEYETLGDEGMDEIRRFVRGGGKYYGICAGAFLATEQLEPRRPRLGLVPWKADDCPSYRGWGDVKLKLTDEGLGVFAGSPVRRTALYWGGPVLVPGKSVADTDVKVLATYDWEVLSTSNPKARTPMRGKAALVGGRVGKGRVYVQCPHPECAEASFDMVLSGFEFLTGVRPTRRHPHRVRGQFTVGYESFRNTEYGDFHRRLVRCRDFHAWNVHDRLEDNDRLHCDAFLSLRPALECTRPALKAFLASGRPVVALVRTDADRRAVEGLAGVLAVGSYDEIVPALRRALAGERI